MDESNELELRDSNRNPDSSRVLVTKRAIFAATCALIEERDFSSISASDIIERAGVSRTTFYRCFSDKYDVINWSFKRYKNIRVQDRDQYHAFDTALRSQLLHLKEYQRCYASALRYLGQNSLRDSMYETNLEYMLQCWHEHYGAAEVAYADLSLVRAAAAACVKIVECWVLEGCVQDPADVVAAVISIIPQRVMVALY